MNSDSDCTLFKQIQGNYWYQAYFKFTLVSMKDNGYFNATKMCIDNGKDFAEWVGQEQTREFAEHLAAQQTDDMVTGDTQLFSPAMQVIMNRTSWRKVCIPIVSQDQRITAIYIHPNFKCSLGCWISTEFAIQTSKIVCDHIGCTSM